MHIVADHSKEIANKGGDHALAPMRQPHQNAIAFISNQYSGRPLAFPTAMRMRIVALLSFAAVACALRLPVEEALGDAPFAPAGYIDFDDSVLVRFHVFCRV